MTADLIIAFLEDITNRFKANEILIARTENEELILDWAFGNAPHIDTVLSGSPASLCCKLAAGCRCMTVLAVTSEGEMMRLWVRDGKTELTEPVNSRPGSRVTLHVPLSDSDFENIEKACKALAVVHLGTRFEISDEKNAVQREFSFENISDYLQSKPELSRSAVKTLCGFADDVHYALCFTAHRGNGELLWFHNRERMDGGVLEYLLSKVTGLCPVRCEISAVLITQGDLTRSAMGKTESVLFDSVLMYLKNRFAFGVEHLNYDITMDLLNKLYQKNAPYAFAIAAAGSCAESESSVSAYSPLVIYGEGAPEKLRKSIANAFEIRYRSVFPHHAVFRAERGNIRLLLHEEDNYDCILFVEDFEDAVSALSWEEQRDLGHVLVQRVYDRKMTLVISKSRPLDMRAVADPLWISINKGLCCELGL